MQTSVYQQEPVRTRAEISRANGAKSRGPKTEEGKAISSRNSLKHGFYAQQPECVDAIERFEGWNDAFITAYAPRNEYEKLIVEQITTATWKLTVVSKLQRDMLLKSDTTEELKAVLDLFDRHIAHAERSATRAHRKLSDFRKPAVAEKPNTTPGQNDESNPGVTPKTDRENLEIGLDAASKTEETNPTEEPETPAEKTVIAAPAAQVETKRTKAHRPNGFAGPKRKARKR